MSGSIEITTRPSTDGSTQTREIGVRVRAPDATTSVTYNTRVTLAVDGTLDGDFRELAGETALVGDSESGQFAFETFVGVQPPYDLRATATFGDDETATTTVRIEDDSTADANVDGDGTGADADAPTDPLPLAEPAGDAETTPRIGPVEPLVMRVSSDLPFDVDQNQTACGETIRRVNGDKDRRIVVEGYVNLQQARRLDAIRQSGVERVEVREPLFGVAFVDFDTLSFVRTDAEAVGDIGGVTGPIYEFQVQSKQDSEDDEQETFGEAVIDRPD